MERKENVKRAGDMVTQRMDPKQEKSATTVQKLNLPRTIHLVPMKELR